MRTALIFALALFATPALAASTAQVSGGAVQVRTGPGTGYASLGVLPNGTRVALERCTPRGTWCLIANTGWVRASYLVGAAAKVDATPATSLVDPFRFGFSFGRDRHQR